MAQLSIFEESASAVKKLSQLIEDVPPEFRRGLSANFHSKIGRVARLYSPIQPEEVLQGLLDKTSPGSLRKNWKSEETSYLLFVLDKYCLRHQTGPQELDALDWEWVAELLPGRSGSCCRFRFLSLAPTSITETPWLDFERELLLRIIQSQQAAAINWKVVSQKLYKVNPSRLFRTGKQCREHYTCFLKPNLRKGPWTEQQDYQLICLFLHYGKKWSLMARFIDGRNENSIKNRFFLMFQNRKECRLTHSDLFKLVRRKKEKIQKRTRPPTIHDEPAPAAEDQEEVKEKRQEEVNEEMAEEVKTEEVSQSQEGGFGNMESLFESQKNKEWDFSNSGGFFENSSEEIEKYISF